MIMKETMVNIAEAKAKLSEYARRVKKGERIILCDRNKPFAEIRALTEGGRPALRAGPGKNQPAERLQPAQPRG